MTICLSVALLSKNCVQLGLKQGRDRGESPAQYLVTQQSYFMRIPAQNIKNTVPRSGHLMKAIMLSCFNKESLQQSCVMCAPSCVTGMKTPWALVQVGAIGWIWAGRCGLCDTVPMSPSGTAWHFYYYETSDLMDGRDGPVGPWEALITFWALMANLE